MYCQPKSEIHLQVNFIRMDEGRIEFGGVLGVNRQELLDWAFSAVKLVSVSGGDAEEHALEAEFDVHEHVSGGAKDARIPARRFRCSIPIRGRRMEVSWRSSLADFSASWKTVPHGWFSPFSLRFPSGYYCAGGHLARCRGEVLCVERDSRGRHLLSELRVWWGLLLTFRPAAWKALMFRWSCLLLRPFHRRLWLFADREAAADDNARALFEYVCSLPPAEKPPKCVFAVAGGAGRFGEVPPQGRIDDIRGLRYKLHFLLADYVISSHRQRIQRMPFSAGFVDYAKDLVNRPEFVYLRHGVSQNDLADDLGRPQINPRILVSSAVREYDSILGGRYGYTTREVKLCGLPRFDRLYDARTKSVTLMPSWRGYLVKRIDSSRFELLPGFDESVYCRTLGELCSDERLAAACARKGYALQLVMHPNFAFALDHFKLGAHVRIVPAGTRYRDIFAQSDLVLTDYSSVAFDFAYLKKPVVYFQPDFDEFYGRQYVPGYFDYRRDGFGEVETETSRAIDRLVEYIEADCVMKPEYAERVDAFFGFSDRNSCRRVYEAVLAAEREDRGVR